MIRTRLLWFSLGFTSSAAVASHFVWKDLWVDRHALNSEMNQKFNSLEARLSNVESSLPHQSSISVPHHDQV
ncbi:uncharacterized protein LOC113849420 isoform X2 [Abrus precatorius]|nr:uncharacterized protein LOC113849420 isoform X2 [Abrus precatorius]